MLKDIFHKKQKLLDVSRGDYLFIFTGLSVFISITLATITKFSIWFDESFSAYITRFSFFDIAKYTASDVHPPLYYWLLKIWTMIFGTSELAFRSLSLVFGCLAIVAAYLLVNRLFGKRVARFSLLFLVLSPMLVRYSQEARMYTMVAFIGLLATLVLTYAVNSKKKLPWIIYGILLSLGMWTHYFSAIVWIAHWLWQADNIRRTTKPKKFIKTFFSKGWVLAHIIAIGLFMPWMPFLIKQLVIVQAFGFWIPAVTPNTIPSFLTNAMYYLDIGETKSWLAFGFLALAVTLAVLGYRSYRMLDANKRQGYRLLFFVAFAPMIILFIASLPPLRSSFIDRYLIASVMALSAFIGVVFALGLQRKKILYQIIPTAVFAGLMIIGIVNVWQVGNYNKNTHTSNNTRQIMEETVKLAGDNQPIIASTPWLFYEAVFYSTKNNPVYYIEPGEYKYGSLDMLKYNDNFKIKDVNSFVSDNQIFWYIEYIKPDDFKAPYSNWIELQRVSINDSISGKPNFTAVQFQASAK